MERFEVELSKGRAILVIPTQRTKEDMKKLRKMILPEAKD